MYILEVWRIASLENFTLGFSIQTLFPQVVNVSKEGLRHLQEPLGPGAGLLPRLVLTMVCRLPSVLAPQQLSIQCHLEAFPWSFTLGFLKKASLFVTQRLVLVGPLPERWNMLKICLINKSLIFAKERG